ncbi:hypothetical protein U0070_011545 [Myodes glareolus]|uniref:Uncharacterized protein n=1 Tax=Myodes glareolus TaxID=447135 RepID=A0AAW0HCI5_MYOGA
MESGILTPGPVSFNLLEHPSERTFLYTGRDEGTRTILQKETKYLDSVDPTASANHSCQCLRRSQEKCNLKHRKTHSYGQVSKVRT